MRAAVLTKYGPHSNLVIKDLEVPVPKTNQLRVRVVASSVTSGDVKMRSMDLPIYFQIPMRLMIGLRKPRKKVSGIEFAGIVDEIGEKVTKFKVGDEIYGSTGIGVGTNAEFICIDENAPVAIKPKDVSFGEAAIIPIGAQTAWHFLQRTEISSGQKVLIYGASGSVGSYAVQIAKYFGAEVTAVCSGRNLDLVKQLGADHVIDYIKEDFTEYETHYDIIYDTVGYTDFKKSLERIHEGGYYLLGAVFRISDFYRAFRYSKKTNKSIIIDVGPEKSELLNELNSLFVAGDLIPVIDQYFPLEEIAKAHEYVESGRKRGNIIIVVDEKKCEGEQQNQED